MGTWAEYWGRRLRRTAGRERGIALIVVLGFLAVMSLIAIGVVGAARNAANAASRELVRAQAQAAVESGIDHAIAEILNARGFAPPLFAKPDVIEIGGLRVMVSARPERAKVDINYADENLLALLFQSAGAGPDQAQALAARVEDWRDSDDLVRVNGAERREYEEAGLSYGPANRFFTSADELRLVLGVSGPLYDCVRPEITILAQRQGVDIDAAALRIRRAAGIDDKTSVPKEQTIAAGEIYEITARLNDTAKGVRRAERASVRITGNPQDPYWVLSAEPAQPLEDAAERSCPKAIAAGR